MLSRASLVGNLGAPLNDVGTVTEQSKRLFSPPHGTGKGARLHNPLDPLAADLDDNSEKAVPEFKLRRFIDKEGSIKAHTAALSTRNDSAALHFADRFLARSLIQINLARLSHVAQLRADDAAPLLVSPRSPKPPGN